MILSTLIGYGLGYILDQKKHEQPEGLGRVKISDTPISRAVLKSMPQKIINYISKNFDAVYGSPFSKSFYSKPGQSWDHTPDGQIRVSDHWNFWSRDYTDPNSEMQQHSVTNIPVENNTHWTIAKKNNKGIYEVIMSLPLKQEVPKKYNNNNDLLSQKQPNEILYKLKIKKQQEKLKTQKNKIEQGKQWVRFDRTYTERISSRRFNKVEEKGVVALLVGETNDFYKLKFSPKGNEVRYKISTISNMEYLKRKPRKI